MKRGEVWSAAGGPEHTGKPRPVVIVQEDSFKETDSITICPLTTYRMEVGLVRPAFEPSASNGLLARSFAMTDKISTIPRTKLGKRLGSLSPADRAGLSRAILLSLGLAGRQ